MSKWVKANLSDVTDITMGQSPDSASYNEVGDGYPFLQGCADFGKRYPKARIFCSDAKKIGRKDSVLISVRAPVGELNLADKDYCVGRGVSAIYPRKVNRDFLFNSLLLNKRLFYRVSQGSTFEAINSNDLNSFSIDYPDDMASQNKIARILNTIDVVIEQTELTIEKLKSIKQGMMHDLFTRGIDVKTVQIRPPQSEAPELYNKTELGWVPKAWRVLCVKQFSEVVSGSTPSTGNSSFWNGEINWITPSDLSALETPFFCSTQRKLTKVGLLGASLALMPKNSLVMSSRAPIGYFAIGLEPFAMNQGCKGYKLFDNQNVYFHYYNMLFNLNNFYRYSGGSTFAEISKTDIERLSFCIPYDPEEQKIIGDKLISIDSAINRERDLCKKQVGLKQGLMQDLLTGKVPVVPDSQDKEYQGVN